MRRKVLSSAIHSMAITAMRLCSMQGVKCAYVGAAASVDRAGALVTAATVDFASAHPCISMGRTPCYQDAVVHVIRTYLHANAIRSGLGRVPFSGACTEPPLLGD